MGIFDFRFSIFDRPTAGGAVCVTRINPGSGIRGGNATPDSANRKSKNRAGSSGENRKSLRLPTRIAACAAALLLVSACQNVPKYKRSSGKFDEWGTYQGKSFSPFTGTVAAVDPAAQTITITRGETTTSYAVTSETRIMHEGTDITIAQLPLNQAIKYTVAADGKRLLTVWYGTHTNAAAHAGAVSRKR
jgi:hypothetical protein